jgi:UDP-glucose 4-epimerase
MKILITGGLGYIGLNTSYVLSMNEENEILIVDNLSNCDEENAKRLNKKNICFFKVDLRNIEELEKIFDKFNIELVIHFASLKSVEESIRNPLLYYDNNLISTINLIKTMHKFRCNKLIFSSSACVYTSSSDRFCEGDGIDLEEIKNPYGKTKYMNETIIKDCAKSFDLNVIILRYFNPVGNIIFTKPPNKSISNLIDVICESIRSNRKFEIFGKDYLTKDGTCIRDFIHIADLIEGHLKAIDYLVENTDHKICEIFNLGTQNGSSVLDIIKSFEKVHRLKLNYEIGGRRQGDLPISISNCEKAKQLLNWECKYHLDDMCKDALND